MLGFLFVQRLWWKDWLLVRTIFMKSSTVTSCVADDRCYTGFPSAFGVFQEYYDTHEPFKGSSGIPVIGTCSMVRRNFLDTDHLGVDVLTLHY